MEDVPDAAKGWYSQMHYLNASLRFPDWFAQSYHHRYPSPMQVETFLSKMQFCNAEREKKVNSEISTIKYLCICALVHCNFAWYALLFKTD